MSASEILQRINIGASAPMQIDMTDANENMDMPAHEKTYGNFVSFVKYSVAFIALLLIAMAIFLT
jgi:Bacterial aa3 type cytochrome c oxidase subunit IV